jgi:hypothetical protein
VSGHDREIRLARAERTRVALDPFDCVAERTPLGNLQHRGRGIESDHAVAAAGEVTRDGPGATSDVDDRRRSDFGRELRVELRLRTVAVGIDGVVDGNEPRIGELGHAGAGQPTPVSS